MLCGIWVKVSVLLGCSKKAIPVRRIGQKADPKFVNRLLAINFDVMDRMGPRTNKVFLQDGGRFDGLFGSLSKSFLADPTFTLQIVYYQQPEDNKQMIHPGTPIVAIEIAKDT
jgi:hypothetical protein